MAWDELEGIGDVRAFLDGGASSSPLFFSGIGFEFSNISEDLEHFSFRIV